ncbi:alpha/beta hydrolase [Saccharopolyspora sp. 5N708]|uniref:alpha/beta hydrolase n=1 Tax=Saccharopolyspora sp. 5N708 TaxID=3457424 RepID=UPI003FD13CAC
MRRLAFRRICAAVLLTAAAVVPTTSSAAASPATCQDVHVPVVVAGLPQTMYGKLCVPPGAKTVQVLVPGGAYRSDYWDIAYTPEIRSFRLAMNRAGYATFAVDRLGTGQSSKPPSVTVTATAQAEALHQVVRTLRPQFDKVILGGHSIGSAMAMIEAGTYHDVDGVLVTGMTHRMNLITVAPVLANMIPAPLDPELGDRGLDAGYLTTKPGTRYAAFHTPGPYDPAVVAADESTKDVFAATEAVDTLLLVNVVIPATRQIDVPVMIAVGNDQHFCNAPLGSDCSTADALHRSEAPFFSAAARLHTYVLNGYGHSINFAPNAPEYHSAVVDWMRTIA